MKRPPTEAAFTLWDAAGISSVLVGSAVRASVIPAVSVTVISSASASEDTAAFVNATASMDATGCWATTTAGMGDCRTVQRCREQHCDRWRRDDGKLSAGRQEFAAILVGVIFGSLGNFRHAGSE
jgi:hypothetical protein